MITTSYLKKTIMMKIEMVSTPIQVSLAVYFIFATGGYTPDVLKLFLIDAVIAAGLASIIGIVFNIRKINTIVSMYNDPSSDPFAIKKILLQYPHIQGFMVVFRWMGGGSLAFILLFMQFNLTRMNMLAFIIIPVLALLSYIPAYMVTESGLEELYAEPRIANASLKKGDYINFTLGVRLVLLSLSVLLIPVVVFGYLLYLVNSQQLALQNIWLHIGFISFLSVCSVIISVNNMLKNIKSSVHMLLTSCTELKNGNFTIDAIPMTNSNELGIVCQQVNELMIKLKDIIVNVKESSDLVST
ncbi:MAG TPA: hypothetical protein PK514_10090, partial [Spirochaetota bacterium]|nr:hypothetical protein [Spirochaetota bacterium]